MVFKNIALFFNLRKYLLGLITIIIYHVSNTILSASHISRVLSEVDPESGTWMQVICLKGDPWKTCRRVRNGTGRGRRYYQAIKFMGNWSSVLLENSGKCIESNSEILHLRACFGRYYFCRLPVYLVNEPAMFLEPEWGPGARSIPSR